MRRRLWKVRFAIFMELAVTVVAVAEGTITGELTPEAQLRWGFGLHNLWDGRPFTLITSTFLVRDSSMFFPILVLIACSVGVYEWQRGTRRTLLLYGSTSILAVLLAAWFVTAAYYLAGSPTWRASALMSDVGPSAGAMGCIGGWVERLPARRRRWVFLGIAAYLIGKLFLAPEPISDSVHLVAFPIGFVLARWL